MLHYPSLPFFSVTSTCPRLHVPVIASRPPRIRAPDSLRRPGRPPSGGAAGRCGGMSAKKQRRESKGTGEDYLPRSILVTGGAGFIASHVVIRLVQQFPQYKIVCFDKLDYCSSLSNLNEVKDCPNFKFIKGNILSADLIRYVLEAESIDTIIHAAAQARRRPRRSLPVTRHECVRAHATCDANGRGSMLRATQLRARMRRRMRGRARCVYVLTQRLRVVWVDGIGRHTSTTRLAIRSPSPRTT